MEKKSAKKKREKKTERNKKETEKETKEEVCEIFKVEKNNKEETIKSCGVEEEKAPPSQEQIKKENRLLRNVFIIMIGFSLFFLTAYFTLQALNHFEYEGVKFDVVKEGSLILYQTSIPGKIDKNGTFVPGIFKSGKLANYRIWLRNDPRQLKNTEFNGDLTLMTDMVINATQGFGCEGDGNIAFANLLKLYDVLKIRVVKDENASCDPQGRYMFLRVQEGNETGVKQLGASCYNIDIRGCEILDGLERFMLETLIEVNKKLKE